MTALRRAVLGAFVVGLGTSITLSQSTLALLTLLWLWRLRDPGARAAARGPLWQPVLAFSAVSLVSALASGHPIAALGASKGLLLVAALYVIADALPVSGPAPCAPCLRCLPPSRRPQRSHGPRWWRRLIGR